MQELSLLVGLIAVELVSRAKFKQMSEVLTKVAMGRFGSPVANPNLGHWFLSSQYGSVF
jgi:hypothetical protein